MRKSDLDKELLKLKHEIEMLSYDNEEELEKLEKKLNKKKEEIRLAKLQKSSAYEILSLEKTKQMTPKEIEVLRLEKTKQIELLRLEQSKKFSKEEMQLLEHEMNQKIEHQKLESELKVDRNKLDKKINKVIEKKPISENAKLMYINPKSGKTITDVEKNVKDKRKRIIIKTLYLIVMITCIVVLFFVSKALLDRRKNDTEIKEQIVDVIDNTDVEVVDTGKKEEKKKDSGKNYYWDFINTSMINVDFTELKKVNKDTKGWVQVSGTNINYPFVQAKDNSYYLSRSFDRSYNQMGWVFLDYRNNMENLSKNTVIYGHGLLNNTMFGSLKKVVKKNWYSNPKNYTIKISTEKENSVWQVFSTYTIKPESYYITTNFSTDESYEKFIKTILKRSVHDYKLDVTKEDNILTLSSCYDDTKRVVLHAKLIKSSPR